MFGRTQEGRAAAMRRMARVVLALAAAAAPLRAEVAAPAEAYLFTYFVGNGEDGLHLAWSRDGLAFEALGGGRSWLAPAVGESKLMRDPCLVRGPDGTFHLVWTTSWQGKTIGYASSKDLIAWSEQRAVPVMAHEPTTENCWAPDMVYDEERKEFLILWSTTIPGRFPEPPLKGDTNHRIYATTTKDFSSFTPARLFFDPGYNLIDATIAQAGGRPAKVGGRYQLVFKEETRLKDPPKRQLRSASSEHLEGPYGDESEPFTRHGCEGASVIRVGDAFIAYYDIHTAGRYGASRSRDFKAWEDITERLSVPKGARHGTVLPVPQAVIRRLMENPPRARSI